ncbi:MFS transporter [Arthrobacter sp. M4]|uniref:MFS transporter n=1 Tax=Arthrobacter sp. M4 TaxID=218160 RepID=UPI001CDB8CDF|nr:MFS transporter [Arthrobacter sp. M4]MCA4133766.1 MFS transporter [Arthrobacter sp. M4]
MDTQLSNDAERATARPAPTRKMTAGLGGGVLLEWYDWGVYGFMAAFLGPHFFPSGDPVASTLTALAVFGAGFFARPLGAAILGPLADRFSHKKIMMLSVSAMAIGSLIIAALPTYSQIGIIAGIVLLVIRLTQGLATGAEAGVANAIAIELAPPGQQGRFLGLISGSFIQAGIFGSSLISFFVSAAIPSATMAEWGWRIPFLIGGLMGIFVIVLRRELPETLVEKAMHHASEHDRIHATTGNVWKALWKARLALLSVVLVIGAVQIANYAWTTALPNLANSVHKENSTAVFGIITAMGVLWIIMGPFVGRFADHIRPSRAFIITRLLLIPAVFTILLYTEPGIGVFALVVFLGGTVVGINMSLYNYIAVTLMPRNIRTTGVAVGYALGVSIFGGTSSYLLVWLQQQHLLWMFSVYGGVVCLLSVLVYWAAKKRGHVYVAN